MGCGKSRESGDGQDDNSKTSGRLNSFLATLPRLFCEVSVGSGSKSTKYVCTAHVPPTCCSVIFGCTDTKDVVFEKEVTQEELKELREAVDVNHTIGWWQFFSALKHAFFNKKVELEFVEKTESDEELGMCNMKIELNFVSIGKTGLIFTLRKAKSTFESMASLFIYPLYDFYNSRTEASSPDKINQLEKQIRLAKEKISALEQKKEKVRLGNNDSQQPNKNVHEEKKSNKDTNGQAKEEFPENKIQKKETDIADGEVQVPAEQVMKILKTMKTKLTQTMSESEIESFNTVINILGEGHIYDIKWPQGKAVDEEILTFLRYKFGTCDEKQDAKRSKKDVTMVSGQDYMKTSNLAGSKTRNDVIAMFDKVDDWNFDVFTLEELTEGHTLYITSFTLFLKYDLLNKFLIPEDILLNFLRAVEMGYHPNPYHNSMHAADVLQVLHYIIYKGGLSQFLTDEDIMAALISAIIHDYDHPGLNNAFQVNSQSYLAILYNDRSVLENHHCAQAFEMMRCKQNNIFCGLSSEQRKDIRETIIQMVLSTDMTQHRSIVGNYMSKLEAGCDFSSPEDVRLALQISIKMADVSNPARPLKLYLKWGARICDEFFKQGDKEKALQLPISPLMDRTKPSIGKGQVAFMDYIICPMFESFSKMLPNMKFTSEYIQSNKAYWNDRDVIDPEDLK